MKTLCIIITTIAVVRPTLMPFPSLADVQLLEEKGRELNGALQHRGPECERRFEVISSPPRQKPLERKPKRSTPWSH